MLPGLPPRDKTFIGWLRPLVIPIAWFMLALTAVGVLNCLLGDGSVTIDSQRYTGSAGAIRIVVAAPFFFTAFLLLATSICWVDSRIKKWRRRNTEPKASPNAAPPHQ
jgi:hypothetical protein